MHHHRQGDKWCIYPMYDFAHPIQDALEGITHSLCSLEFEDHRPLYNWVVEHCRPCLINPRQIEFARLGIDHTVHEQAQAARAGGGAAMSPAGMTPGCPPCAACAAGAIPPSPSATSASGSAWPSLPNTVEYAFLEHCLREDLNETAQRVMAVLQPVKLTITNYPEGRSETVTVENNPNWIPRTAHGRSASPGNLWIEAGRFPGRADSQVQASVSQRAGVPPEGRVPHHLHRLRQG